MESLLWMPSDRWYRNRRNYTRCTISFCMDLQRDAKFRIIAFLQIAEQRPIIWPTKVSMWFRFSCASGTQPILHSQSLDSLEFSNVVCNKNGIGRENMSRSQQIVATDNSSRLLQLGANESVVVICFWFERQNFKGVEQLIDMARQDRRAAPGYPIPKFSRNDDAGG